MFAAGQRNHREAVRERRQVLFQFVRRTAGGNKIHLVKIKPAVCRARDAEMSVVDGVERAAEKRDAAGLRFGRGTMRLRGGQCAS